nr:synaptotagmin-2-like [Solea senegalensis]
MEAGSHGQLLSAELNMPFSDSVKYILLGTSVALLLVALGILTWQTFRYCKTRNTYTRQATVHSDVLYLDEKPRTAENYSAAPSSKVEEVSTEVLKLSRCLPQVPIASTDSSHTGEVEEQGSIKKVDGSLRFSVHYDQPQSRLGVTILQVKGLHCQTGGIQPFVKVRVMWAGSRRVKVADCKDEEGEGASPALWTVLQEWQTRIVKGICSPLFGEKFSCVLEQEKDMLQSINLRMEVWDFDKFSRNTLLGHVRAPLGHLNISDPLELHEDLQIPQKDLVGEVLLSLKFLPTSQRLEVGLLKVRTVLTNTGSDSALYARISVQCNHYKLGYQKTSAVSRDLVTIFNEVLMFSLPEFPMEQCKILVSVYETHTSWKSTKHLMGQLTVGKEKGSEDKHWTLMMRSVRQPVAKWHSLLI